MRTRQLFLFACLSLASTLFAQRQNLKEREDDFATTRPLLGERLPDVGIYTAEGTPFQTSSLKGHYTVLTFGCLTCPPSIWNIPGLEAVARDYEPKGVKFYFVYKSLAHPEIAGGYVQPITLEERLEQVKQARLQFDTRVPWLVDAIDNRFKHAMGDRPNSQFIVDPDGMIVRKRAWSNPQQVREDLKTLVGPSERVTQPSELELKLSPALKPTAAQGVVERIPRLNYAPIVTLPQSTGKDSVYYAKLRAEADASLITTGTGILYLGFHLDPFHRAHWNNLAAPLKVQFESSDQIVMDSSSMTAAKPNVPSDSDPREFLINVKAWPVNEPLTVKVNYFACVDQRDCFVEQQVYVLERKRDADGGGARGAGPGYWEVEEFTRRMMAGDKNGDRRLSRDEAVGLVLPHFEKLDANGDGLLDRSELSVVTDWLNHRVHPFPEKPQQ